MSKDKRRQGINFTKKFDDEAKKKLGKYPGAIEIVQRPVLNRELESMVRRFAELKDNWDARNKEAVVVARMLDEWQIIQAFSTAYLESIDGSAFKCSPADEYDNMSQYCYAANQKLSSYTQKRMFGMGRKIVVVPNPLFSLEGIKAKQEALNRGNESTIKYLKNQRWYERREYAESAAIAMVGQATFGIGSAAISVGVAANKHHRAAQHMKKYTEIQAHFNKNQEVKSWMETIKEAQDFKKKKQKKSAVFSLLSAGKEISKLFSYAGSALGTTESIFGGHGTPLDYSILTVSIQMHWRAYQEQFAASPQAFKAGQEKKDWKKSGQHQEKVKILEAQEATRIITEIFSNRGVQGMVSYKDEVINYINEPAGWLPIWYRLKFH